MPDSFSGAVSVAEPSSDWTFLTNHTHVLFCLARDPDIRLRDVADRVGITERAVQRIVTELEDSGYITRQRQGRRNTYSVHQQRPLRHNIESHRSVADLLQLILGVHVEAKQK
jgi:DNA-binding MarR family transcriptional regulator